LGCLRLLSYFYIYGHAKTSLQLVLKKREFYTFRSAKVKSLLHKNIAMYYRRLDIPNLLYQKL
jgi:hypothetical protein